MSKYNKIFIAIVLALLITAITETFFIFVYKPPQQIPISEVPQVIGTPVPQNLLTNRGTAINPGFLDAAKTWPYYDNQRTILTTTVTGVLHSITPPSASNPNYFLRFKGVLNASARKDLRGLEFSKEDWDKINVFDTRENKSITAKTSDLVPGQSISVDLIYGVATSTGWKPDVINISIIK